MTDRSRHDEFVELLARHQNQLFGYICALVRNFDHAEDLFQQTSLVMWQRFSSFEADTSFLNWGCQVARFVIANFQKRQRRSQVYLSDGLAEQMAKMQVAVNPEESDARLTALAHCLEKLREPDRRLIALCYGGADDFSQAAAQVGRKVDSVYVSLSRIRNSLLNCIEKRVVEEERS